MRYYKTIENGYVTAIGTGGGGTEITEQEYNQIINVIRTKSQRTETTDYQLREDLTWEEYERIDPITPEEPQEEDYRAAVLTLLGREDEI